MMNRKKKWISRVLTVMVAASALFIGPSEDAAANEAQFHIYMAAYNLGQAAARENVFGRILASGVPPAQIAAIAANLDNATASLIAAEDLFGEPFRSHRAERGVLVGLTTRIAEHPTIPRPANPQHMERMLYGISHSYGEGLELTYDTRNGYDDRPTCDSLFQTIGYYCGVATIVSNVTPPNRRTGFRASAIQSDANNQMVSAIELGLKIALDGVYDRDARKIACPFGTPDLWDALPLESLQPDSPPELYAGLCSDIADIAWNAKIDSYEEKHATCASTGRDIGQTRREDSEDEGRGSSTDPFPATCNTNEGLVRFTGSTQGLLARYGTDQGRIFGTIRNTEIEGYWVEAGSNRACESQRDGSDHWGRLTGLLTATDFDVRWSYCNDTPAETWAGRCSGVAGQDDASSPDARCTCEDWNQDGRFGVVLNSPSGEQSILRANHGTRAECLALVRTMSECR